MHFSIDKTIKNVIYLRIDHMLPYYGNGQSEKSEMETDRIKMVKVEVFRYK